MKAAITDKTLGINVCRENDEKFRDVRKKAHDEYIERAKKRKKDRITPVPLEIGTILVLSSGYHKKEYILAEVVDYEDRWRGEFNYFCLIHKVTNKKDLCRIGRLCHTERWNTRIEKVPPIVLMTNTT